MANFVNMEISHEAHDAIVNLANTAKVSMEELLAIWCQQVYDTYPYAKSTKFKEGQENDSVPNGSS